MNKKIKLGIVLSLVTILSFYSVSGTFAKYTSSIDLSDEARVALWDFDLTRDVDLFHDSYIDKNGAYVKSFGCKTVTENGKEKEICDNVIAPGTSGEYTFRIKGAPETSYQIKIEVIDKIDTVGRITYDLDGECPSNTIQDLAWCLENLYSRDEYFDKPVDATHTISWKWQFENPKNTEVENKKDTDIGSKAIIHETDDGYFDQAKVKLTVRITAEQYIPTE